jgi:hypothetical protein
MNVFEKMVEELKAIGERSVNFSHDPFQVFGYVLNSGHGTYFQLQRPVCEIPSAWVEVFSRKSTVKPHDYSVEV